MCVCFGLWLLKLGLFALWVFGGVMGRWGGGVCLGFFIGLWFMGYVLLCIELFLCCVFFFGLDWFKDESIGLVRES